MNLTLPRNNKYIKSVHSDMKLLAEKLSRMQETPWEQSGRSRRGIATPAFRLLSDKIKDLRATYLVVLHRETHPEARKSMLEQHTNWLHTILADLGCAVGGVTCQEDDGDGAGQDEAERSPADGPRRK